MYQVYIYVCVMYEFSYSYIRKYTIAFETDTHCVTLLCYFVPFQFKFHAMFIYYNQRIPIACLLLRATKTSFPLFPYDVFTPQQRTKTIFHQHIFFYTTLGEWIVKKSARFAGTFSLHPPFANFSAPGAPDSVFALCAPKCMDFTLRARYSMSFTYKLLNFFRLKVELNRKTDFVKKIFTIL